MQLTFLGATDTVTGSRYLLTVGKKNILIDCGLFQGLKALRLRNWAPFPISPSDIDAVILTHAHLDHSGTLPLLVKQGFRGKIYCTPATRDLCGILLPDSGYLQEEEARFAGAHGFSKHKPPLPLYTRREAEASLAFLQAVPFHTEFSPSPEIKVTFLPAGHILGAAMIYFRIGQKTILFSGDLGRPHDPIMVAPTAVDTANYLIVESTYGNRRHGTLDPQKELADCINRTVKRGGIVVIPSFAVGRTQTLLYYFYQMKQARLIPDVPIFLNSPMAIDVTGLYQDAWEENRLSPQAWRSVGTVARFIHSAEDSKSLNHLEKPAIIISASGMATGGRVLHHLKAYAPDPKNMILLAGYQAAGTRGANLRDGAEEIKIHGEHVPVRAEIVSMDSLSAHADYIEILDWLSHFTRSPAMTFITHGEPAAAAAMRLHIQDTLHWPCTLPTYMARHSL